MRWTGVTKGFFNKFVLEINKHDIEVGPVMNMLKPIKAWEEKNKLDPLANLPTAGSRAAAEYARSLEMVHRLKQGLSIVEEHLGDPRKHQVLHQLNGELEEYEEEFKKILVDLERRNK